MTVKFTSLIIFFDFSIQAYIFGNEQQQHNSEEHKIVENTNRD